MKLSVRERLLVLNIFPQATNFATLKIIREAEVELGFSEKEMKNLDMKADGNQITWNNEKDKEIGEKEIKIGDNLREIIKKSLKELDANEKLTREHFSLYEKFFG